MDCSRSGTVGSEGESGGGAMGAELVRIWHSRFQGLSGRIGSPAKDTIFMEFRLNGVSISRGRLVETVQSPTTPEPSIL